MGEEVDAGAEALRLRDADGEEVALEAFGVEALRLRGDEAPANGFGLFMSGLLSIFLRLGDDIDVSTYEYCCRLAPKPLASVLDFVAGKFSSLIMVQSS